MFCFAGEPQAASWTLKDCVDYALSKNIDIRKSYLSSQGDELNLEQARANVFPSVTGSVGQNFSWAKAYDQATGDYTSYSATGSTSYGLNSGVTLFNGFRSKNTIEQARLNLESSRFYSETVKESVELSILDAYLQILYAKESVKNAEEQIKSTTEQLAFAEERLNLGVISNADYLQIRSELASEKLTLANAQSTLSIAKVNLMQLMELPVDDQFDIVNPDLSHLLGVEEDQLQAASVYQQALAVKPQIRQAELNLESARLDEKIARSDLYPQLSVSAGLSTGWSNRTDGEGYAGQLKNSVQPAVGLNLSIPIFQNKQARISIRQAQISAGSAELDEINTKNDLRKKIEQAIVDLKTAYIRYQASLDNYQSTSESYDVAVEKYELGLLNSVDFLSVKTTVITSENDLAQARYNLIFSNKILDFYKGVPIRL